MRTNLRAGEPSGPGVIVRKSSNASTLCITNCANTIINSYKEANTIIKSYKKIQRVKSVESGIGTLLA